MLNKYKCEKCGIESHTNRDDIICYRCYSTIFNNISHIDEGFALSLSREYGMIAEISYGLADKYLLDEYKNLLQNKGVECENTLLQRVP